MVVLFLILITPKDIFKESERIWGTTPISIEIKLKNPKPVYLVGEPILLEAKIKNVSNEVVKANFHGFASLSWRIYFRDKEGKSDILSPLIPGEYIMRNWDKLPEIAPGDSVIRVCNLAPRLGSRTGCIDSVVFVSLPYVINWREAPLHKPFWWGKIVVPLHIELNIKRPAGNTK